MSTPVIAIYSLKGGVGKTTLAVNLAWAAAVWGGKRALLWDLDAQAAASYILGKEPKKAKAGAAIKGGDAASLVKHTEVDNLDLLPADASLRDLDVLFRDLDKKKRLAKLASGLGKDHDIIVIDCPPGLTDTSEQVLRAADLVVVPVIPSALSRRALQTVTEHVETTKGMKPKILPVYSMVDRRRALHREAIEAGAGIHAIPMASAFERMAEERAPLGAFTAPSTSAMKALRGVWSAVESALA